MVERLLELLKKNTWSDEEKSELIEQLNNLGMSCNLDSREVTWKCFTHGYCTGTFDDLIKNQGEMLWNFQEVCCGFCGMLDEEDEPEQSEDDNDIESEQSEDIDFAIWWNFFRKK